jgi:hypothetical protein
MYLRNIKHTITHKIYISPKREISIIQIPIKNLKTKTNRTINQQNIKPNKKIQH